tara:strand:- start:218 stop:1237 length:1020 start_codon:yes stop_codon:yes gene_type:complete
MLRYKINKISEISKDQLSSFYKRVYNKRYKSLVNNWRWWYRAERSEFETLVLSIEDKIIGQAGVLPIDLKVGRNQIPAIWFVDFVIIPEFQGKGFGQILTKEWMKICPNQITFCNNQSLKIFKKFGWKNNLSTKRFLRPINFFKITPVTKKIKLDFADSVLRYFIKKKYNRNTLIKPHNIKNNFKIIQDSFKIRKTINNNHLAEIVRDEKWLYWRLIECPYNEDIFFFEYKNNFAIVHIFTIEKIKKVNILYTYFTDSSQENELYILIVNWAINNNIDLVWTINKSQMFNNIFPKLYTRSVNFASWSSNEEIFKILQNGLVDPQAIDSDIDSNLYVERK